MTAYPPVPSVDEVEQQFSRAIRNSRREDQPYRHWLLKQVLPIDICTGILTLPIVPAVLGQTDGTRGTYNDQRTFITPLLRTQFPTCAVLAAALQRPAVARLLAETLESRWKAATCGWSTSRTSTGCGWNHTATSRRRCSRW